MDGQSAASVQRTVGRIEGRHGVFATVYRAELKRFGIDVVIAAAGNMRTGVRKKRPLPFRESRRG